MAIYPYSPNLPDELRLEPDTIVTIQKIVSLPDKPALPAKAAEGFQADDTSPKNSSTTVGP